MDASKVSHTGEVHNCCNGERETGCGGFGSVIPGPALVWLQAYTEVCVGRGDNLTGHASPSGLHKCVPRCVCMVVADNVFPVNCKGIVGIWFKNILQESEFGINICTV